MSPVVPVCGLCVCLCVWGDYVCGGIMCVGGLRVWGDYVCGLGVYMCVGVMCVCIV